MRTFLPVLAALVLIPRTDAESAFHNFSAPPHDVLWPVQIVDTDLLMNSEWAGDFAIRNEINNTLFIDDDYLATGNAPGIDGRALWGNPRTGSPLGFPWFSMTFDGFFWEDLEGNVMDEVTTVSFDFAWASTDVDAELTEVGIAITDYDFNTEVIYVPLNQTFFHSLNGGGTGYAGRITITPEEVSNIFIIQFTNLHYASPEGHVGEFAIDNLQINEGSSSLGSSLAPVEFDGSPATSYGTNSLKSTGNFSIADSLRNSGDAATTFTVTWTSNPSGVLQQQNATPGRPIAAGETIHGALAWQVNTDTAPSGAYTGKFTVNNDGNPSDPDDEINLNYFRLYDPPALSDNTGTILSPGGQPSISNAAASGHAGALRASIEVTAVEISNPRFSLTGIAQGSRVNAGGSLQGTIGFNAAGAPAGTYSAQLRVKSKMTGNPETFLNRSQPVPDRVWTLTHTIGSTNNASSNVTNGQELGNAGLAISGTGSGAAIAGGSSNANQQVAIAFNPAPPQTNPSGTGSAVAVNFGVSPSLYVLQLSYASLPAGYAEADLRVDAFNGTAWVPAISLNGNGGATVGGAAPYAGSYQAFLASVGGGSLNAADLGAFGVDAVANTVWVIVDYQGLFQIKLGAQQPAAQLPVILGITVNPDTKATTISYQSVAGQSYSVEAAVAPGGFSPIGTTGTGNGAVMQFNHTPAGNPATYFYRFATP